MTWNSYVIPMTYALLLRNCLRKLERNKAQKNKLGAVFRQNKVVWIAGCYIGQKDPHLFQVVVEIT